MVRPPLSTRAYPAELLQPSEQTDRQIEAEVSYDVAMQLYSFPTPEYPDFRTFVNEPVVEQRIFTNFGRDLAPDIVVLQWPEKTVKIVGDVLTTREVTWENAAKVWWPLSRLEGVAFYLYVPAGYANLARRLIKDAGIKKSGVGLRTWRRIVGLRALDIAVIR
jgi:hypothetical protein